MKEEEEEAQHSKDKRDRVQVGRRRPMLKRVSVRSWSVGLCQLTFANGEFNSCSVWQDLGQEKTEVDSSAPENEDAKREREVKNEDEEEEEEVELNLGADERFE